MNDNLFKVLIAIIPVLGAIVTGFIVPYLKTKIDSEKLSDVVKWVTYSVQAAEMLFVGEKLGEDKKEYVIGFIIDLLNKKKIVISREQLEILIESAVKELNASK